jgi:peptidoglycan/xylan/chitin deacetylase (PgdA/CDA1 family)
MALLAEATALVQMPRQMLNAAELKQVREGSFELGAHGHTHAPLTAVPNAAQEIASSINWLQSTEAKPLSMSFPHGAHSPKLVNAAREAGFELIFTSAPELQPTDSNLRNATTLGRIHIPENQWTCENGEISFPSLATFLFFRPKAIAA